MVIGRHLGVETDGAFDHVDSQINLSSLSLDQPEQMQRIRRRLVLGEQLAINLLRLLPLTGLMQGKCFFDCTLRQWITPLS